MNWLLDRQTLSHLTIVVSLSVFGWIFLVDAKRDEIVSANRKIADLEASPFLSDLRAMRHAASSLSAADRAADLDRRSDLARNSALQFAAFMEAAEEAGLAVEQVTPGHGRPMRDAEGVVASSISIDVFGTFEDLAWFLGSLEEIDGFVRPVSVSMSPRGIDGEIMVSAQIECEAVGLASALAREDGP